MSNNLKKNWTWPQKIPIVYSLFNAKLFFGGDIENQSAEGNLIQLNKKI